MIWNTKFDKAIVDGDFVSDDTSYLILRKLAEDWLEPV